VKNKSIFLSLMMGLWFSAASYACDYASAMEEANRRPSTFSFVGKNLITAIRAKDYARGIDLLERYKYTLSLEEIENAMVETFSWGPARQPLPEKAQDIADLLEEMLSAASRSSQHS
jgi:hypothetical protein